MKHRRHRSLMRTLHCQARSPLSASSRLPGGERIKSSVLAASSIASSRVGTISMARKRLGCLPSNKAFVSLQRKFRIVSAINTPHLYDGRHSLPTRHDGALVAASQRSLPTGIRGLAAATKHSQPQHDVDAANSRWSGSTPERSPTPTRTPIVPAIPRKHWAWPREGRLVPSGLPTL